MQASVKKKILGGTAFLFCLTVLAGSVSIYYLVTVRQKSKNILAANYESIQYAHRMQECIDGIDSAHNYFIALFNRNLQLQEANVTEPGEKEATMELRAGFARLSEGDKTAIPVIRLSLQTVLALNMQAIQVKYAKSEKTAADALTILISTVSVILLIGGTFVYNFPSILTDPIHRLTEAIKQIGTKNYSYRVHINSKDEFGELANAFNEMAERLEYFENSNLSKIIFEKARAEAVINSLPDASIGVDKKGKVLFANNQALQLLGMGSKEVVGHDTAEVSKKNDLFRFLLEEHGNIPFKIVVDNKENYFTRQLNEVGEPAVQSKVIVLKNITSFKELDVAKTNFIATVSHELKTPLAASDLSLKLLEDPRVGQLTGEQKELVDSVRADNQRMLRILSELLNLSQVEAGHLQLNIQPVSPYEIVKISCNTVSASAKEKSIELKVMLPDGLPDILGDADKTVWVLNNFLTNAIRYAPPESMVTVEARLLNGMIFFSVTDHGQGIEQIYLPRLFERYFQVPGRSDKNGSGIGLAICKEMIEAMGGTVDAKSTWGEGSSFSFSAARVTA